MNKNNENEFTRLSRELGTIKPTPEKIQHAINRVHQALNKTQSVKIDELNSVTDHDGELIVQKLEVLSEIKPSDEQICQAMLRTKRILRPNPSKKRISLFRRVLMMTGIAAAIFVSMVLLYNFAPNNEAQAGLTLGQVLEAQRTYKGWYRVDTEEYDNLTLRGYQQPSDAYWSYTDPSSEQGVSVHKSEEGFWIYWLEKPRSTLYFYDETSNTLRISLGIEIKKQIVSTLTLPLNTDLHSVFAELEAKSVQSISKIQATSDGSYERFDISETYFTDPKIRQKIGSVTFWVDPATKLIHKWECQDGSGNVRFLRFNYDVSPIRNVYDLGVPPLVKVIDNRPTIEVQNLLGQLELKRGKNEHFGEYVAILSNSKLGQDLTLQKSDLLIYSRQKEGWVYAEYSAGEISNLNDWPLPNIPKLFEQARSIRSTHVFVDRDEVSREGWYQPAQKTYRLRNIEPDQRDGFVVRTSLSGFLWPGLSTVYSDEFDFRVRDVKIIKEASHPGLNGLVVDQWGFGPQKDQNRIIRTYWLDPMRDDLSTEREYRSYTTDGTLVLVAKTKFQSYGQLPNGKYYPTLWRTTTWRYENGELVEKYENESHLAIVPGLVLDANWFAELIGLLQIKP